VVPAGGQEKVPVKADGPSNGATSNPVAQRVAEPVANLMPPTPATPPVSSRAGASATKLRTQLRWTRIALGTALVLAGAAALVVWNPPWISGWVTAVLPARLQKPAVVRKPTVTPLPTKAPPQEALGSALLLGDGSKLTLRSGLLLDAKALNLGRPFTGLVLEVSEAPAHSEWLILHNRSRVAWRAVYPGESSMRKIEPSQSLPAKRGAKLMFGKVTVEVVSI